MRGEKKTSGYNATDMMTLSYSGTEEQTSIDELAIVAADIELIPRESVEYAFSIGLEL